MMRVCITAACMAKTIAWPQELAIIQLRPLTSKQFGRRFGKGRKV